jgi:hypothetical protein
MFDLKWKKSPLKKAPQIKMIAADSFLADLDNLGKIKESNELKERDLKKEEDYNKEYVEGLRYLNEFINTSNSDNLKKAANKFYDALKFIKTRIEPYFYLSYIFYVFNQRDLAIEYLEIARSVDSARPELQKIQQIIYSNSFI